MILVGTDEIPGFARGLRAVHVGRPSISATRPLLPSHATPALPHAARSPHRGRLTSVFSRVERRWMVMVSDPGQAERVVLAVDDDAFVRKALHRWLLSRGYTVFVAASGAEALELLEQHPAIQLLISDNDMPGMTGLELLKEVRRRFPKVFRIMLTGAGDQQTLMRRSTRTRSIASSRSRGTTTPSAVRSTWRSRRCCYKPSSIASAPAPSSSCSTCCRSRSASASSAAKHRSPTRSRT